MIKLAKDWAIEIVRRADEAGIITDHDGLRDSDIDRAQLLEIVEDVLERAMQEAAESGVL